MADNDVTQLDVASLQARRAEGTLTAVELFWASVERIGGTGLNAVRAVNPDALAMAEASDRRARSGRLLGPLDGIPILLKDNIDTGDKMPTTAGSVALAGTYADRDASLVRRLRRAGAVLLGKANLTEWANWMAHHMPNGYSSLGGQVQNPYGPGQWDVGGSSSGSGSAVAAGLTTLAVGTETSGSILSPSSSNSVVGIKPTVGLVSRRGIVPISWSQDTAGPMARTVADAAVLLEVMAGRDRGDPATWAAPVPGRYRDALRPDALVGVRLGIARRGYWERLSPPRQAVADKALAALSAAGATIVEVGLPTWGELPGLDVLRYEFQPALNAYLAGRRGAPIHSLADLVQYNQAHAGTALRYGQAVLLACLATSADLTDPQYWAARRRDMQTAGAEGIDAALVRDDVQALIFVGAMGAGIAAKAGYPSVTVPAGYTEAGEPVGITFTGSAWQEARLLGLAFAFEQATRARRPPDNR